MCASRSWWVYTYMQHKSICNRNARKRIGWLHSLSSCKWASHSNSVIPIMSRDRALATLGFTVQVSRPIFSSKENSVGVSTPGRTLWRLTIYLPRISCPFGLAKSRRCSEAPPERSTFYFSCGEIVRSRLMLTLLPATPIPLIADIAMSELCFCSLRCGFQLLETQF